MRPDLAISCACCDAIELSFASAETGGSPARERAELTRERSRSASPALAGVGASPSARTETAAVASQVSRRTARRVKTCVVSWDGTGPYLANRSLCFKFPIRA